MPPAQKLPAGQTIRQQAKNAKGAAGPKADRSTQSRDVVKPVLATPFGPGWPNLPNHLQAAVMAALPQIITPDIPDYHVSRKRCSRAAKKARKIKEREDKKKEKEGAMSVDGDDAPPEDPEASAVPPPPATLEHLVLGLNETIKALEHGIDDLRFRMAIMGDILESKRAPAAPDMPRFLPTEPKDEPETGSRVGLPAPEERKPVPPVAFVLVPHLSVSPMSLVDPLPGYAATYNTLLAQYAQQSKAVRSRAPDAAHLLGPEAPEIRIVPLGRREHDVAAAAGLRRVAAFAVRGSHPSLDVLERLLPKSVLHPPRHSMTLPFPSSRIRVGGGAAKEPAKQAADKPAAVPEPPIPAVHYAPIHIKGLRTTTPADPNGRKQRRLAEVRARRVESKEKRKAERHKLERAIKIDLAKAQGIKAGRRARQEVRKAKVAAKAAAATPAS